MIATLLFAVFIITMMLGVPIGASLGLAGAAAIALANAEAPWFGLLAVPQNFYAGLGKYPLLAIPMFVLVGSIFDRSGVALRLVNFAIALAGRGPEPEMPPRNIAPPIATSGTMPGPRPTSAMAPWTSPSAPPDRSKIAPTSTNTGIASSGYLPRPA